VPARASWIAAAFIAAAATAAVHGSAAGVEQRALATAAGGAGVPLLAADSPTAVLMVTAECAKCRIGVPAYGDVRALALREGFGFRSVVSSGPVAARQFALLLPDAGKVAVDADQAVLRSLRVQTVPALVLVDSARQRRRVLALEIPFADTARLGREIRAFR
jgi:hypothetical protein